MAWHDFFRRKSEKVGVVENTPQVAQTGATVEEITDLNQWLFEYPAKGVLSMIYCSAVAGDRTITKTSNNMGRSDYLFTDIMYNLCPEGENIPVTVADEQTGELYQRMPNEIQVSTSGYSEHYTEAETEEDERCYEDTRKFLETSGLPIDFSLASCLGCVVIDLSPANGCSILLPDASELTEYQVSELREAISQLENYNALSSYKIGVELKNSRTHEVYSDVDSYLASARSKTI